MYKALRTRIANISRELALFAIASFMVGMAGSLVDSVFNNYLNATYPLTGFQRSFLEIPRELPGFLVVFASAALWFIDNRKLGALSLFLAAAGILLLGVVSKTYAVMVLCLFIYSVGQHLFMPVSTTVGMELAAEGRTAHRLGQFNAIRNLAVIAGSGFVYIGFKFLNFNFTVTFAISAGIFTVGMVLMALMKKSSAKVTPPGEFLKLHREYSLYYALAVLSGARKQIFLTFAPWVIVTIYGKPTQVIATLILIGGVIGILVQPLLGKLIDKLGERTVLMAEAVLLIPVCLAYGFSKSFFSVDTAFLITCACYLVDQVLVSVSMARSTYMKKIALQKEDIQPALSLAVSIDHFFSIGVALIGGVIWNHFGYQFVFLMGVVIAVGNFFSTMQIRIPKLTTKQPVVFDEPVTMKD
jgi:predicted MFS family arabinose efflux permease